MKAIDTIYKGYRFRSRLEARWAVFFDALEWEWEYEKEGYQLPGGNYLPDFYFPEIKSFGEVKPKPLSTIELQKCKELKQATGCEVFLLVGTPDTTAYENIMWYNDGSSDDVVFVAKGCKYYPYHWGSSHYKNAPACDWNYFKETVDAVNAARSARFEFGESGAYIKPKKEEPKFIPPPEIKVQHEFPRLKESLDKLRKEAAANYENRQQEPITQQALNKAWDRLISHYKDKRDMMSMIALQQSTPVVISDNSFQVRSDIRINLKAIEMIRNEIEVILQKELKNELLWIQIEPTF